MVCLNPAPIILEVASDTSAVYDSNHRKQLVKQVRTGGKRTQNVLCRLFRGKYCFTLWVEGPVIRIAPGKSRKESGFRSQTPSKSCLIMTDGGKAG